MSALEDLFETKGAAVVGYCARACRPLAVAEACAEAFRLVGARSAHAPPAETDLLSATRHGAAAHITGTGPGLCARTPELLARRADGTLDPREDGALAAHMRDCVTCRDVGRCLQEAEQVFLSLPAGPAPAVIRQFALGILDGRSQWVSAAEAAPGSEAASPQGPPSPQASRWLLSPEPSEPPHGEGETVEMPAVREEPPAPASPWLAPVLETAEGPASAVSAPSGTILDPPPTSRGAAPARGPGRRRRLRRLFQRA